MGHSDSVESQPIVPRQLVIAWAILVGLAIVVGVGLGAGAVDYPTPFAISHAYRLLVGGELFFMLVVVPLWVRGDGAGRRAGLLELVLLLAIAAPAVVVASWVSDCDGATVAASQAYLLAAACFVAGYVRADRAGRWRAWYWVAAGTLGAGAPFLAFVTGDLMRTRLGWLYAFSPFWVADRLSRGFQFGWDWAVPFGGLVLLAAGFYTFSRYRR